MIHLLLQTAPGRARTIRDFIRSFPGVHGADLVSGPFDLVVVMDDGRRADELVARFAAMSDVLRILPCHPAGERALEAV